MAVTRVCIYTRISTDEENQPTSLHSQRERLEAFCTAQEAWRIGLVNRVVPAERLLPEAEMLLREILDQGPLAVRSVLECVEVGSDLSVEEGLLLEATHFGLLSSSADMREGTAAFLAKRKAAFTGR